MLKAALCAALLTLGVAICGEDLSQQPSPSSRETGPPNPQMRSIQQQQAADHERGTRAAPLIVEMINPPNSDAIASEIKKNRDDQAAENWRGFIFNSLLATVGILQAIALGYTALVSNKAANAAKVAADAVIAQMRAYVSVVSARIYGFDQDNESRILVRIGNTGDSTAFDVTGEAGVTIQKAEIFNFEGDLRPKDNPPISRSRAGMGPKTTFDSFNILPPLAPDLKAAIRAGTHGIFAYGEIRYKDAIGNHHRTTYRLMYGGGAGADPNGLFVTCEQGNDSD
jgi:hypothetical protein